VLTLRQGDVVVTDDGLRRIETNPENQ